MVEDTVEQQEQGTDAEKISGPLEEGVVKANAFLGEELRGKLVPEGKEIEKVAIESAGSELWQDTHSQTPTGEILQVYFKDGSQAIALRRKPVSNPFQGMMVALAFHSEVDMSGRDWKVEATALWDGKNKLTTDVIEQKGALPTHMEYVTENGVTTFTASRPDGKTTTQTVKGEHATQTEGVLVAFRRSIPSYSESAAKRAVFADAPVPSSIAA